MAAPGTRAGRPVLIRVDGGDVIGYGHLMRSLALREQLRRRGVPVVVATRWIDGSGVRMLEAHGAEPHVIPESMPPDEETGWVLDSCSAAAGTPRAIFCDGYHFPETHWHAYAGAAPLAVSDVFGGRDYRAASIVYNAYAHAATLDYSRRHPSSRTLLGPKYAMLRRGVRDRIPEQHRPHSNYPRRILVNGGGVDEHDVAGRIAAAMRSLPDELQPGNWSFVVGEQYPFRSRLERLVRELPGAEVLVQPDHWLDLLAGADLALIAGGSTQYEAAALGTPFLPFVVEDNQEGFTRAMATLGATRYTGRLEELDDGAILEHVRTMIASSELRADQSRRGRELVDGRGVERVADTMLEQSFHP